MVVRRQSGEFLESPLEVCPWYHTTVIEVIFHLIYINLFVITGVFTYLYVVLRIILRFFVYILFLKDFRSCLKQTTLKFIQMISLNYISFINSNATTTNNS